MVVVVVMSLHPYVYHVGQKGAIVELFGWPHADVKAECKKLGELGYLGVKVCVFDVQNKIFIVSCSLFKRLLCHLNHSTT